jgi:SAM-dependent methyltransferase
VTTEHEYVHGYAGHERTRLVDQATTLTELLHADTAYAAGSLVLEAACGVGAQTVLLAPRSAGATIVSVDIAGASVVEARRRTREAGARNVVFAQADLYASPFRAESVDHVFVCFLLEHLRRPDQVLAGLMRVLKPGGTMTVIEGDHGSVYFHPENADARRAIQCLIDLQARSGGNSLIGRSLYPLLVQAGVERVEVSPRVVYADASRPQLVDGFTRKTFTAMVEGVRARALATGLIDPDTWTRGIRALHRTAEADGTFCYTFFKAVGRKPR